jgi:protein Mpv17
VCCTLACLCLARLQFVRTVRFAVVGLTCHGPYFNWGFGWVDRLFGAPTAADGTVLWLTLVKKTAVTQFVLNPPYMVILFAWMGLLEGRRSASAICDNVRRKFPSAFWAGNLFWPIANFINFRFLGPEHRVAYVAACGAIWNTYISWLNHRREEQVRKRPFGGTQNRSFYQDRLWTNRGKR